MKEHLLSINKYDNPTILEGQDSTNILLVRLLLLVPGSIQSRPDMGVGIISKWRYTDMEVLSDLEIEIERQLSMYLPHLAINEVEVTRHAEYKKEIVIKIVVDNTVYGYETTNEELKLYDIIGG